MSRWFRMYDELLDDPKVQRLHAQDFRAAFEAACRGQESVLSPYISGPFTRPAPSEWALLRATVFERDSYTCTYCGTHGVPLECDHVVPVAKGGAHGLENLTTACRKCNRSKRDKLFCEWIV